LQINVWTPAFTAVTTFSRLPLPVIPAKAGIQNSYLDKPQTSTNGIRAGSDRGGLDEVEALELSAWIGNKMAEF
jgi:hypothetical protein